MANSVTGQESTESYSVIGYSSGQERAVLPLGITRCVPEKIVFFFHIITPLLTKLARSRWLDVNLVLLLCLST